ncbi:MAG: MaoC family dehydratase [Panacagrimonas sp.]
MKTIGIGFYYEDLPLGFRFRSAARTLAEADLGNFVNLTWLTEEIFTNHAARQGQSLPARVVPGALVMSFAEGLLTPAIQHTGLAFLHADLDVRAPTCVGDTIHVECEVIEARTTSRGDRGLVRCRNRVLNQHDREVLVYTPLRLLRRRQAA